jgi:UDP-N-acetylglucosamine 2-epimerase
LIGETIVFPMHPRTRNAMQEFGLSSPDNVVVINPVSYLDMIALVHDARVIMTDSGGVQKEAYWLSVPCVTLRDETEWVETVTQGWNVLAGGEPAHIALAFARQAAQRLKPENSHDPINVGLYGDGHAARRCVAALETMASG